jgi:hypothetical protein
MAMAHGLTIQGVVIPPEKLRAQMKRISSALQTRSQIAKKGYKAQAAKGPFVCPECNRFRHKRVEFPTSMELGKHRRFAHNIAGSSSNAVKSRELTAAKKNGHAAVAPATVIAPAPASFPCLEPNCGRTFDTAPGLKRHMTAHQSKELTFNGDASHAEGISLAAQNGQGLTHATAQALTVAYAAGQCKGLIAAVAESHDFPPRQLAERVARTILAEAKR